MPPLLVAERLGVRLGAASILRKISFTVEHGTWVGLVGPNGAGKSTLLRTLSGLLPYEGRLDLRGRPVHTWPARERAREVALVRQSTSDAPGFTVRELVELGRAPHLGWLAAPVAADVRAVADALGAMDLAELAERPVAHLSGGEQQRVLLAQALAQDAPLLLLDEPTAHLDIRHQLDLLGRVRRLADGGRTVLAAIHDLELAARFADRLLVLDGGGLVADGPPESVLTPSLLRETFAVEAEVAGGPDGMRLRYLRALS